jgi:hypothetical protein
MCAEKREREKREREKRERERESLQDEASPPKKEGENSDAL